MKLLYAAKCLQLSICSIFSYCEIYLFYVYEYFFLNVFMYVCHMVPGASKTQKKIL